MQQPNRNTTALQPLSSTVLRKKPKGPEDGEPSNQPNRNTTALQPLFSAVLQKKPKGSAIRTLRTDAAEVVLKLHFKTDCRGLKALCEVLASISDDRAVLFETRKV
ncbi:hypothetical protein ACFX2J_009820 [Malus domestica]